MLVLALLGLPLAALAGPAGFAFLEIPAGARASAMGGATCSLAQGAEAIYLNPAGLAADRGVEVVASHYEYFESLRHDQFAAGGILGGIGLAASVRALYSEPIPERDELGNLIGSFGSYDLELALGAGGRPSPGLDLGGTAKLVRERIANSSAMTYAFDVGAGIAPDVLHGVRIGATAQNLGPAAHYDLGTVQGEPVPLPAALQAGLSYPFDVGGMTLSGALEARFTRGRSGVGLAGAELAFPQAGAAVRMGLRLNDSASSFSAGAGWAYRTLHFDYAFVPYLQDLGDTHRFSLSARF